jgi:hypothetical protein
MIAAAAGAVVVNGGGDDDAVAVFLSPPAVDDYTHVSQSSSHIARINCITSEYLANSKCDVRCATSPA